MKPRPRTLAALLRRWGQERGDERAYTFLSDGERETGSLTFGQLDVQARAIAACLQRELDRGDRALIVTLDGQQFLRAFLGCQYAGVIAVPAVAPLSVQSRPGVGALAAIARDCGARAVLSDMPAQACEHIREQAAELASVPWVAVSDIPDREAAELRLVDVRPRDVAFLQYTSGSTSAPKGVVVTHEALMRNEELITHWMGTEEQDVLVQWLPLFHDMGLIGGVLQVLYTGAHGVLLPPFAFIQRPERWLRAISRYRGTISGGPNFAYELCARRVSEEDRADIDLRSWRWAYNGAEPVRDSTLRSFGAAFARCGFDPRALSPCYGLAETTLLAVGCRPEREPVGMAISEDALTVGRLQPGAGRALVSSGRPMLHRRIEIADPVTRQRLGEGEIGEIWVAGPDVASGYWGRPAVSERTFRARIEDDGDGPFLRTGDLGALHEGRLFVTGRLKDVIIVAGRNHYPQDIEATVEEVDPAIRRGCCAAFTLERDDAERVCVLVELKPAAREAKIDLDGLRREVCGAVARAHGIGVEVAFLAAHSLPKTSSGKLQRGAARAAFERGELPLAIPAELEEIA